MGYLFGDTNVAAERLRLLAQVFERSSVDFLNQTGIEAGRGTTIIDLGCGPGHTTRLLAGRFPRHQIIGIDNSAHFIEMARIVGGPHCRFVIHDVTSMPLPADPCDAMYGRFLLTHLQDIPACIARWTGQLKRGGQMVFEEVEAIETDHEVLCRYLQIVQNMFEARSQTLYVGPSIDTLDTPGLR